MIKNNTRRGFTQINKHVVICPPCKESQGQRPQSHKVGMREQGKGVVNKATLLDNPPSALCATSPTLGGKSTTRGFTLIELLVVVLIIGILAAVAVPQYKKAVLKSRFSAVMPMAKSVADANEVYYLGNNMYALGQDDLDVTPVTAGNTSVKLSGEYQNADENYEYVAAWRTDVPGVRYIMYQKNSPKFASNIHCEADETNEDALWLCEKGLNGTEIPGSINTASGEYKTFLLAGNTGEDTLPTSLVKLAKQLCGNNENCTYEIKGNTLTTAECSGDENATGGQLCINKTYDDTGAQVDYEKKVKECRTSSGIYPNKQCNTWVYNQENTFLSQKYESCSLSLATWENGQCVPSNASSSNYSGTSYYDGNRALTKSIQDTCSSFNEGKCSTINRIIYGPGSKLLASFSCKWPDCSQVDSSKSKWYGYDTTGARTEQTTLSYSGNNTTFTTRNIQTGEVVNTITCSTTKVNWETGTCEE